MNAPPLPASEAVAIAELLFERPAGTPRLRDRLPSLALRQSKVLPHTLAPDPVHASSWYLIVANQSQEHWLLHLASASAPASSLFPKSLLLARARLAGGLEIVANAIPLAENLSIVIPALAPHLLARAAAIHDIWSVESGAQWPDSLAALGIGRQALPAVRASRPSWDAYLPALLGERARAFCYILSDVPEDLNPETALPYSRFRIALANLDDPNTLARKIQNLRKLTSRAVDIELDLSGLNASAPALISFLNDLRLVGAAIEGIEPPPHIDPRELSSPQLAITIRAQRPSDLRLPGPIHWMLKPSAT